MTGLDTMAMTSVPIVSSAAVPSRRRRAPGGEVLVRHQDGKQLVAQSRSGCSTEDEFSQSTVSVPPHDKKCRIFANSCLLQRCADGLVSHDHHVKVVTFNVVPIEQGEHTFDTSRVNLLVPFRSQHNDALCKQKKWQ